MQLPPKRERKPIITGKVAKINFDTSEITGDIREFAPVYIEIARPGKDLDRWRSYVEQYHMLGFKKTFGSRLQYFIKSGNKELGCIQFSASSWALSERG